MCLAKRLMTILNVAEKNDAAKAIANFLSNGQAIRKEGRSKFNKLYEFNYNFNGSQNQMIMTSVSGHLMNYQFPNHCKNWTGINPVELFDQPVYKVCIDSDSNLKRSLEELIRKCDFLIIWTDCDREGENIGMEIVDVCTAVKSNIMVKRAKFSQITKASVTRAMNNLIDVDILASKAVDVRQELDLRIGASFTRLQTLHLRRMFPEVLPEQIISYGSCQFPTLGFVVERYKSIENFIMEPFWKIVLNHKKKSADVDFNWDRIRLFDEDAVIALLENISNGGSLALVFDISTKPKSKWRPFAMDTIEMEKLASRKLNINAKTTMQIAEKLYSQGYISYPRTETNIFPTDIDLKPLVEIQTNDDRWKDFSTRLLATGIHPRNGKKTDNAHPPIHPLKLGSELQGNEARIYELVVRHFLACLSQDATGSETKVSIECVSEEEGTNIWPMVNGQRNRSGIGEIFHITGLVILERNYLEVYHYDKWSDKELPLYENGEIFKPAHVGIEKGSTSPPQLLTEADLIDLMDKHGIGTDATHAEHIAKVKERNYIGNRWEGDKYLVPGKLGMGLVEGYDLMQIYLSRSDLRAKLESDLEQICRGSMQSLEVLQAHIHEYKNIFQEAVTNINKLVEGVGKFIDSAPSTGDSGFISTASQQRNTPNEVNVRACPNCNGFITLKKPTTTSWILGCLNYPACKYTVWLPSSVEVATVAYDLETGSPIICPNAHENAKNYPVHKISVKFNCRMNIIVDIVPDEDGHYVFCLYCHEEACELLNIKLSKEISIPSTVTAVALKPVQKIQTKIAVSKSETTYKPVTTSKKPIATIQGSSNSENVSLCLCGQPTVQRKVSKEGPNKGRLFNGCAQLKCNSFSWSDATTSQNTPSIGHDQSSGSSVKCDCNIPAKTLTVMKENANKGRNFYGCSTRTCHFFQWSDESPSDSKKKFSKKRSQPNSNNLPNKKTFTSTENMWPPMANDFKIGSNTKAKVPRRCTRCRDVGHTAKNCPNT